MKNIFKYTLITATGIALQFSATSCLDEAFPENNSLTSEQLVNADMASMAAAIPGYLLNHGDGVTEIGWCKYLIWMDQSTTELPLYDNAYNYFSNFSYQLYIGNGGPAQGFYTGNYYLIQKCNSLIGRAEYGSSTEDAPYMGTALTYRAMAYMNLARLFEYKRTGVASIDDIAEERGIWGLTVPIITESSTEEDARSLPRAPFYEMYRFIYTDLCNAEESLANTHVAKSKIYSSLGVAYGMQAQLWLEIGTRFYLHPEDLSTAVAHEDDALLASYKKLGVNSANEAFAKAAQYARYAINEGYTPVTESEWYNPSTGFNKENDAWMLDMNITPDNDLAKLSWRSWVSYMCPEADWGIANASYNAYKMIDAKLYTQMDANDWRRYTWINVGDMGDRNAYEAHYKRGTLLSYEDWCDYATYAGFKFHPGNGDTKTANNGNAVAIPLMRVEEMYLIEAEALAHCQGAGAGKQALESFMNSYRMMEGTTYTCPSSNLDGVIDAIWTQKRIEFWGEGITFWDFKRREIAIERGYPGTNHYSEFRYNSLPDYVAPWQNFYIPNRSGNLNPNMILNPDPSGAITQLWSE